MKYFIYLFVPSLALQRTFLLLLYLLSQLDLPSWSSSIHSTNSNYWPHWVSEWESLSHIWLFVTPWTVACQAPLSMEISRPEYWSGQPFPPPGDLPTLGTEPRCPTLQVVWAPREALLTTLGHENKEIISFTSWCCSLRWKEGRKRGRKEKVRKKSTFREFMTEIYTV